MLARRRSAAIILAVAAASVLIDQVVKTIAERALSDGPIELVFGARLVLAYNSGAAFSVGGDNTAVIKVVVPIVIVALVAYAVWTRHRPLQAVSFGLIIGGAAGNLFDRLLRDNGGRVIDYIEAFKWYPVFNVADISLFCGIALMLWISFREPRSS